jgi:hypothetical protein
MNYIGRKQILLNFHKFIISLIRLQHKEKLKRDEVLTSAILYDVSFCSMIEVCRRFGGMCTASIFNFDKQAKQGTSTVLVTSSYKPTFS